MSRLAFGDRDYWKFLDKKRRCSLKGILLVNVRLLGRELGLLLRFPSAIPQLLRGPYEASMHIERLLHERYQRRPVELKRVSGFSIYLDSKAGYISPYIAQTGFYELATTEMFRLLVREGDTVIDVGANIGWYTLLAASIVRDAGRVLAFEPAPENHELLLKSIAFNHFNNVTVFNKVVSDSDGQATLYLSPNESMTGLPTITRDLGGRRIQLPSTSLDTVANDLGVGDIRVLKVDVEGAEPSVISGALSLLSQGRVEYMIVEWNPAVWRQRLDLIEVLAGMFRFYKIRYFPTILRRLDRKELLYTSGNFLLERCISS